MAARVLPGLVLAGVVAPSGSPPSPSSKPVEASIRKAPRSALRVLTIILKPNGLSETRDCQDERAQLRWSSLPCGPDNRRKQGNGP